MGGEFSWAFDQQVWTALTTVGADTANSQLAMVLLLEVLANAVLVAMAFWVPILFFRKDRCLPTMYRVFMIFSLFVLVADGVAIAWLDLEMEQADQVATVSEISRQFIATAIWVPYFSVSQRVRNTFVR